MQATNGQPLRVAISSANEAHALVDHVLDMLMALAHVVGEETSLVKSGQLTAALKHEGRKSELAGAYMKGLETVKANAVALARLAPDEIQRLKLAHGEFLELIGTNQAVLATARSVSETIVRDLAREANPPARAAGYGLSTLAPQRPAAAPLVLSKQL